MQRLFEQLQVKTETSQAVDELQKKLTEKENEVKLNQDQTETIALLQSQLAEQAQHMQVSHNNNESLAMLQAQTAEKDASFKALEDELKGSQDLVVELRAEIQNKEQTIIYTRTELESAASESVAQYQDLLSTRDDLISNLQSELDTSKSKIAENENLLAVLRGKDDDIQRRSMEQAAMQTRLEQLLTQQVSNEANIAQLEQQLEAARSAGPAAAAAAAAAAVPQHHLQQQQQFEQQQQVMDLADSNRPLPDVAAQLHQGPDVAAQAAYFQQQAVTANNSQADAAGVVSQPDLMPPVNTEQQQQQQVDLVDHQQQQQLQQPQDYFNPQQQQGPDSQRNPSPFQEYFQQEGQEQQQQQQQQQQPMFDYFNQPAVDGGEVAPAAPSTSNPAANYFNQPQQQQPSDFFGQEQHPQPAASDFFNNQDRPAAAAQDMFNQEQQQQPQADPAPQEVGSASDFFNQVPSNEQSGGDGAPAADYFNQPAPSAGAQDVFNQEGQQPEVVQEQFQQVSAASTFAQEAPKSEPSADAPAKDTSLAEISAEQVKEKEELINKYQEELTTYQQVIADWQTWAETQTQTQSGLQESLQQYTEAYNSSVAEVEKLKADIVASSTGGEEEVTKLQSRLRTKEMEVTDLNETIDRLKSENADLKEEVTEMNQANNEGLTEEKGSPFDDDSSDKVDTALYDDLKHSFDELTDEKSRILEDLSQAKDQLEKAFRSRDEEIHSNANLKETVGGLQSELAVAQRTVENNESIMKKKGDEITQLESDKSFLESQLQELNVTINELQEKLSKPNEITIDKVELENIQEQLKAATAREKQVQDDLAKSQSDLEAKERDKKTLEEEKKMLEEEQLKLKEEIETLKSQAASAPEAAPGSGTPEEIAQYQAVIAEWQTWAESQTEAFTKMQESLQQHVDANEVSAAENTKLQEAIKEKESENEALISNVCEIDDLKKKLEDATEREKHALEETSMVKSELEEKEKIHGTEIDAIKAQQTSLQESAKANEASSAENTRLQEAIKEKESEIEQLKSSVEGLDTLKKQLEEATERERQAQEGLAQVKSDLKEKEKDHAMTIEAINASHEEKIEADQSKLTKEIERLKSELESTKQAKEPTPKEISEETAATSAAVSPEEIAQYQTVIAEWQVWAASQTEAFSKMQESLQQYTEAHTASIAEITKLQETVQRKEKEIQELKSNFGELEGAKAAQEEKISELTKNLADLKVLQEEAAVKEDSVLLQSSRQQSDAEAIEQLKNEINENVKAKNETESQLKEMQRLYKEQQVLMENAQAEVTTLRQSQSAASGDSSSHLSSELERLNVRLNINRNKNSELESNNATLTRQLAEINDSLSTVTRERMELSDRVSQLNERIESLVEEKELLQNVEVENLKLKTDCDSLKIRLDYQLSEKSSGTMTNPTQDYADFQALNQKLQMEIHGLRSYITQQQSVNESLQQQVVTATSSNPVAPSGEPTTTSQQVAFERQLLRQMELDLQAKDAAMRTLQDQLECMKIGAIRSGSPVTPLRSESRGASQEVSQIFESENRLTSENDRLKDDLEKTVRENRHLTNQMESWKLQLAAYDDKDEEEEDEDESPEVLKVKQEQAWRSVGALNFRVEELTLEVTKVRI